METLIGLCTNIFILRVKNYISRFLILPAFSCLLFFAPELLNAQPVNVVYEDSIVMFNEEADTLYLPSYVMVEHTMNEIYVVDGKGRIMIFTSDLFPLYTLNKKHGIDNPQGIAVDSQGRIYVAQASSKDKPKPRISVFSPCLQWDRDIYFSGFERAESFVPYRLVVDAAGNIHVTANHYPGVVVLNNAGSFIERVTPDAGGENAKIINVSLDKTGKIYLVSEESGRIFVYDKNRKPLFEFGKKGGSSGKLSRPRAVAVDEKRGLMYVADYMRHTIIVYDDKGSYLFEFGGRGWGPGWFQNPIDIDVDDNGRVLVADFLNERIQIFVSK